MAATMAVLSRLRLGPHVGHLWHVHFAEVSDMPSIYFTELSALGQVASKRNASLTTELHQSNATSQIEM